MLPIDEHEKAKLLPIRSPRLRLRLVVHWIEQLNNNWWVFGLSGLALRFGISFWTARLCLSVGLAVLLAVCVRGRVEDSVAIGALLFPFLLRL